jgi:glucose/arabinose dehydrogenase
MAWAALLGCGGGGGSPSPAPPGGGAGETITGRERIGWDQAAASAADLATLRYAIYVDGTRSEIAEVSCASTAGPAGFACSGRLPPMSSGTHTLEIATFRDAGGVIESSRSAPLRVTIAGATAPSGTAARLEAGDTITTADGIRLIAEQVAAGLKDPTDLAIAPDGRVWITDTSGRLIVADDGSLREAVRIPETEGRGGLLGVALAPDFATSRHLFVVGAVGAGDGNVFKLLRYRATPDGVTDRVVLLPDVPASASPSGALRFGPDGRLYAAFDNGGDDDRAVRLSEWSGKILRLERDGRTPADQPAASPVLWSGIRTPRGMAWSADGTLWAAEDGVDGLERLRAIESSGGSVRQSGSRRSYALPQPFGGRGVAVHSGAGEPFLSGDVFLAGGDAGYLLRIAFDADDRRRAVRTEHLLDGRGETIRAVAVAGDGSIYVCTADALWRFTAAGRLPRPGSR